MKTYGVYMVARIRCDVLAKDKADAIDKAEEMADKNDVRVLFRDVEFVQELVDD